MAGFATTRWTLITLARGRSVEARQALAELCRAYWKPLYAQKSGGGIEWHPLDVHDAERRWGEPAASGETPEQAFERAWAETWMARTMARLRAEQIEEGKGERFERLEPLLAADSDSTYSEIGRELRLSEGAIKSAVHRLRQRYRALLREEVATTIAKPEDVESELRDLLRALER